MIAFPTNKEQWWTMACFLLEHAGVQPGNDLKTIGWVSEEGELVIVVGFTGFMGSVAQIHMAFASGWHFSPRALLHEVFKYAFETAKREMLVGVVNSKNEKAMKMDMHLGFTERFRFPGMHDDGGDIVVLAMKKSECRYLEKSRDFQAEPA